LLADSLTGLDVMGLGLDGHQALILTNAVPAPNADANGGALPVIRVYRSVT
jgi:hypothetical protein